MPLDEPRPTLAQTAPAAAPPTAQGHLIADRYEVGEVIGIGAMGEVRAGRDRRLSRDVAIKILRAGMAHQPAIRQRFEDEARLAAGLAHPHVVAVFDCGEDDGTPYLIMERLSGRTLADDIAGGRLGVDAVRTVGLQILDALGAAHAAGIVHRDVKPGNVLVARPGCWKVGDFGIAKSLEVSDQSVTVAGMVIGTPAYLAPERLAGGRATVSSDLYATGVVLYEALTARRPVAEGAPLTALLTATPIPVRELRPDVPPPLADVVMRALARDPAERFSSAGEMADALRRATSGSGADTVAVPSAAPPATQVFTKQLSSPDRGPTSLRRVVLVVASGVAVLVVIVLAVSAFHHDGSAPTTAAPPTTQASPAPTGGGVPAPLDAALQHLQSEVSP